MEKGARKERCETCRFWDAASLLCRRLAPGRSVSITVYTDGNSDRLDAWVQTRPTDWCGEWMGK